MERKTPTERMVTTPSVSPDLPGALTPARTLLTANGAAGQLWRETFAGSTPTTTSLSPARPFDDDDGEDEDAEEDAAAAAEDDDDGGEEEVSDESHEGTVMIRFPPESPAATAATASVHTARSEGGRAATTAGERRAALLPTSRVHTAGGETYALHGGCCFARERASE